MIPQLREPPLGGLTPSSPLWATGGSPEQRCRGGVTDGGRSKEQALLRGVQELRYSWSPLRSKHVSFPILLGF